jgi:hypothetical protein
MRDDYPYPQGRDRIRRLASVFVDIDNDMAGTCCLKRRRIQLFGATHNRHRLDVIDRMQTIAGTPNHPITKAEIE